MNLNAGYELSYEELRDKVQGMWLGQMAGNMAGRETEGKYSGSFPNPADDIEWIIPGPESYWPGDDDTDIEYLTLHILETHGLTPEPEEMVTEWLAHTTTSGIYISNRQGWYLMNNGYLPPETGSRNYNEHWYSIDSQITTEILGLISPGMPQQGINLARTFSRISNDGFAVHASEFQVAMFSYSWFESDIENIIIKSLATIPESSRSHKIVEDVLNWYRQDISDNNLDWKATRKKIYDHYGSGPDSQGRYYNWVESTINLGATVLALLYGQGDYKETVRIGVLAGWDCDCNPAIAGGIIGILKGRSGLPNDLFGVNICSETYRNNYRQGLPDPNQGTPQYESISSITDRIAELTEANILSSGGSIFWQDNQKYYVIIDEPESLTIQPEKANPSTPAGLVQEAIAAGISVTPFAFIENFDSTNDLFNLNQIIDGITDNSYNGVRPYRSYDTTSNQRESDYYGIEFGQTVLFDSITFYEGDIVWEGINNHYSTDIRKGGYFEELAVEVLVDNTFVAVSAQKLSEPLDKNKYYQVIDISFEPIRGSAIRIIGTPGGSQSFTTILELQANGTIVNTDFNSDNVVNIADFALFADSFLSRKGTDQYSRNYDIDNSDLIDLKDLYYLIEQWLY